jgi:5'-nucleotidase/UDP-sugar diphosphatase
MNALVRRLAVLASLFALVLAVAPADAARKGKKPPKPDFRLTLIHNNDGESKLATGDSVPEYGGAPRFETVVQRLRAEAPEGKTRKLRRGTLLVSSGDNFLAGLALLAGFDAGPPWPDSIVANALGYDAMTIGNHEFDFGQARLAEYIDGVKDSIPFITANLGFDDTIPELQGLADEGRIVPSVVVRRSGEKIGVIGLTTPEIATISSPGNVEIGTNLAAIVNQEVRRLRQRDVNKIIVSAHLQGIAADEAVIPKTRGVDVWIAGGGDDLLANPDDTLIGADISVGPYPSPVTDAAGNDVLVVSTAGEYKYVGRLTATFSPRGVVKSVNGGKSGPVRVSGNPEDDDFAAEDPRLHAVVDRVDEFVADLEAQVIGETEVDLQRSADGSPLNDPIRRRESGYGNLVADSFLWKAQQLAAELPEVDEPQVAIANGGGIRADILTGEINRAQTFAALPFFNQVVVLEDVPCEALRQLLERGVSGIPEIQGRFANIAGMRMEVDPAMTAQVVTTTPPVTITTPGARVRNLWLDNGTPQDTADDTQLIMNGTAVGACPTVDLATTDFTARDGDAYPFTFQGLTLFASVGAIYNEALEDYVEAPAADGGLEGVVGADQYPEDPVGVRRITIAGD